MPLNNAQKLIAHIRSFLAVQDQVSADTNKACQYRGKNNTRCSVGCLIPEDMYEEGLEFKCVYTLGMDYPELIEYLSEHWGVDEDKLLPLLFQCQNIHDKPILTTPTDTSNWWQDFTQLMEKYAND